MHALTGQRRGRFLAYLMSSVSRFFWRVRRFVLRLFMVQIQVPQHIGSFAVVLFLSALIIYGVRVGGHGETVVRLATTVFGFSLERVEVVGNERISQQDIISALGVDGSTSLINFDVNAARDILVKMPWVQSVDVQKVYPNNLRVSLVERQPFAVWQHRNTIDEDVFEIIDKEGKVIAEFQPGFSVKLPLIVGFGAKEKASHFVEQVQKFPKIANNIRAFIRVGDRRWDILMQNGVRIKLPEKDAMARLAQLVDADNKQKLLSRDILSVDLRVADRMVFALSDEALARHNAAIEQEERRLKAKAEKRV